MSIEHVFDVVVVPTIEATAYADGDLVCDATAIPNAVRNAGGKCELVGLHVADEASQSAGLSLYLTTVATSWGTVNSAPSLAAADLRNRTRGIEIPAANYTAVGAVATEQSIDEMAMFLKAATGSTSLYFAVISRGTPTYGGTDKLRFRFTFRVKE